MIASARWLAFRLLAVLAILVAGAIMWQHRGWFEPQAIQRALADRPWAPLAFVALHVAFSLLFVPRSVMALAAGLLFGLWWGMLWAMVGAMAGAWAGFGLARLLGGDVFGFARLPRVERLLQRLERGGWRAVLAIRVLPMMPHSPVNYAFGLTGIGWGAYGWGSFLGLVPSTVVVVGAGAAGRRALGGAGDWLVPLAVGGIALAASLLLPRLPFLRRHGAARSGNAAPSPGAAPERPRL